VQDLSNQATDMHTAVRCLLCRAMSETFVSVNNQSFLDFARNDKK